MGAVDSGTVDRDTMACGLDDRVLFRVDTSAKLMLCARRDGALLAQTTHHIAVRRSRGRTVVPGSQDALVLHEHGADLTPSACGALGYLGSDRHEILIP